MRLRLADYVFHTGNDLAGEHILGEAVDDFALEQPLDRAGSVGGVVAVFAELVDLLGRDAQADAGVLLDFLLIQKARAPLVLASGEGSGKPERKKKKN